MSLEKRLMMTLKIEVEELNEDQGLFDVLNELRKTDRSSEVQEARMLFHTQIEEKISVLNRMAILLGLYLKKTPSGEWELRSVKEREVAYDD